MITVQKVNRVLEGLISEESERNDPEF